MVHDFFGAKKLPCTAKYWKAWQYFGVSNEKITLKCSKIVLLWLKRANNFWKYLVTWKWIRLQGVGSKEKKVSCSFTQFWLKCLRSPAQGSCYWDRDPNCGSGSSLLNSPSSTFSDRMSVEFLTKKSNRNTGRKLSCLKKEGGDKKG